VRLSIHVLVLAMVTQLSPARAQVADFLPVTGTMNWNLAYGWVPARPDGWPADSRFLGTRFGGRIGVAATSAVGIGLAVASWEANDVQATSCVGGTMCEELLRFRGEAIATTAYLQWQTPLEWFVRGGIGPVRSDRYVPDEAMGIQTDLIRGRRDYRLGFTLGLGRDVRVARLLFVTLSLDSYVMPTIKADARELRWAILGGLGLTVR